MQAPKHANAAPTAISQAHLLHSGRNVAGVGSGHGLQRDAVRAAHLDGADLQAHRQQGVA